MYKIFGYINIVLVVLITSQYWMRKLNQWVFKSKSPNYNKLMKMLRKIHKPAAAVLLVSIAVHGWLALGSLTFHTGTVVAASFVTTMTLGLLFYLLHKKRLIQAHRLLALLSVLLVAVHLLFPALFSLA